MLSHSCDSRLGKNTIKCLEVSVNSLMSVTRLHRKNWNFFKFVSTSRFVYTFYFIKLFSVCCKLYKLLPESYLFIYLFIYLSVYSFTYSFLLV